MGARQPSIPTNKVLRDLRKAKKENAETDSYIYNYAKIAEQDLEPDEIPF